MKQFFFNIIFIIVIISGNPLKSQVSEDSASKVNIGLEDIIIEEYYFHSKESLLVKNGKIPEGSKTYRIFVDMASGYKLQALYGLERHPLKIATTTKFYNDSIMGERSGKLVEQGVLFYPSAVFDSWLTLGAASQFNIGIMKVEDSDGSFIEIPLLNKTDGYASGTSPQISLYNIDLGFFEYSDASDFIVLDGVMSVKSGLTGPTKTNRVLIAQLTTDGFLSFKLNLQLISPQGDIERYVAENAVENEILYYKLNYSQIYFIQ